ncbi:MAG: hypothetical protein Q9170_001916 [Blastenia crenularia]
MAETPNIRCLHVLIEQAQGELIFRERRQREERDRLLAEQRRIFGGEAGEDDEHGLCSNMLDYFAGLDFITEADGRDES